MSADDKTNDAWEAVRHLTLDQIVTKTKLSNASALRLNGFTTPEKYPFVLVLAIAGPGNEAAVELADKFNEEMKARVKWSEERQNPKVTR
jgi:hypothetical protein